MSRLEKRLSNLRHAPNAVTLKELVWVLEATGFALRRGSKHPYVATHPKLGSVKMTIPDQSPVKPIYVKRALQYIDDVLDEGEGE